MSYFFKDVGADKVQGWQDFIDDLNSARSLHKVCNSYDYYEIFFQITLSLIHNQSIILIDSDISGQNLLNSDSKNINCEIEFGSQLNIKNKQELIDELRKKKDKWTVTLYSSGTTGNPKKIVHNFSSLTRNIKIDSKFKDKIWGFAYNPTHMAGIQVFLQAIMNGSSIIRLFGLSPTVIKQQIYQSKITHFSSTPTFLQMLLPIEKKIKSVERITTGGEKYNEGLTKKIKEAFPNAKITNVYASTEAGALFATDNENFVVNKDIQNLVKIKEGELYLHKSLLAKGDIDCIESWYPTGDIVNVLVEKPLTFKFERRKSSIINVGGYNVNPHEVEDVILKIDGVKQVRVFAKTNSLVGNIICAEVVSINEEINEQTIRKFLNNKLQEFKIPRIIKITDNISVTRTGKIKRK